MARINIQFTRFSAFGSPLIATAAAGVAADERAHSPDIDPAVLASTIEARQKLGNWSEHKEITREALEVTLDVFRNDCRTVEGDAYAKIVAPPPG